MKATTPLLPLVLLLLACVLLAPLGPAVAWAADVVVGVNLVNAPYNLTVPEQETILNTMHEAGVRVIRGAIPPGEKGTSWAELVYAHEIKIEWLVDGAYAPGTPWPHAPNGFNGMWEAPPLSKLDPDKFRAYFEPLLAKLEATGTVLAGFELLNEFNWAGFNADFPLPGQGRVFGAGDLLNNPEGQLIAKGYLQYLKTLAVLKDIRDHAKLNRSTPIISGGLADLSDSTWPHQRRADAVDVLATFDFLRAHGLDDLVDGYGIHSYPHAKDAAGRLAHIEKNGLSECQPVGAARGKPCWFTEWGVGGTSAGCPVEDAERSLLVREMRGYFAGLARQSRLKGAFYYNWQGFIHAPKEDLASAFRCGALTASGRLAIAPL
jgi:hypothetical protein